MIGNTNGRGAEGNIRWTGLGSMLRANSLTDRNMLRIAMVRTISKLKMVMGK